MSNLIKKNKKKLLVKTPVNEPETIFKIENNKDPQESNSKNSPKKSIKSIESSVTVRVNKTTRNRLNALVYMGKASSVDDLLEQVIDTHLDNNLTKEELKLFNSFLVVLENKK